VHSRRQLDHGPGHPEQGFNPAFPRPANGHGTHPENPEGPQGERRLGRRAGSPALPEPSGPEWHRFLKHRT